MLVGVRFIALGLLCGGLSALTQASDSDVAQRSEIDEAWRFTLFFPMVWAPSIDGDIKTGEDNVRLSVTFDDIVDNLAFGLMGEAYAHKGPWTLGLKLNYLKTEDETQTEGLSGPIFGTPIISPHDIKTDLVMSANDLIVGYRVFDNIDIYTGARFFITQLDMAISPVSGEAGLGVERNVSLADETLVDWITGISVSHHLSDKWRLSFDLDGALAGDNDKDIMWDLKFGYQFKPAANLWLGWRYLNIQNQTGEGLTAVQTDFSQSGPMLGVAFTW